MESHTEHYDMTEIKKQFKEINYIRILVEVVTISGLIFGFCWAIARSKGNDIWAPKQETEDSLQSLSDNIHNIEVNSARYVSQKELSDGYVTRNEVKEFKTDFMGFTREQRAVNREILHRLPYKK